MGACHNRRATKHGIWSASGSSPTRCASTCSGSRRRCVPTRATRGGDEELWGVTGLVHDLDYERFPDLDDTENGHPRTALRLFAELGWPQELIDAVAGHATFLGVPRETEMAKALFAVDELSGFIAACALVRPTGIEGMKPKSVQEEAQAAVVRRRRQPRRGPQGAEELGVDFDEHVGLRDRGDGELEPTSSASVRARTRALEARLEDPDRVLVALAVLLAINTIVVDSETKDAEVTIEGGADPLAAGRRRPGDGHRRAALASRRRPDRAPALLRMLAALVGLDGSAAGRRPPRDPDRPARPRRLGEAEVRLLDRGPGAPRRRGARPARRPGRGRRRPLAGRRRRRRARGAAPASSSTASRSSTRRPTRATASLDFLAKLDDGAGDRAGAVAGEDRRRWSSTATSRPSRPDTTSPTASPNPDQVVDDNEAMTYTSFTTRPRRRTTTPTTIPLDQRMRQRPSADGDLRRRGPDLRRRRGAGRLQGRPRRADRRGRGRRATRRTSRSPDETAALINEFAADAGDDSIPPRSGNAGQKPGGSGGNRGG